MSSSGVRVNFELGREVFTLLSSVISLIVIFVSKDISLKGGNMLHRKYFMQPWPEGI